MGIKFTIAAESCPCKDKGVNGRVAHTAGPVTLYVSSYSTFAACSNHAPLYDRNGYFRAVGVTVPEPAPQPLLKTVHVRSKQTGNIRTLVVKRAVSGQPVWYVQSDSGAHYMVQFRRDIWLCECKHFIARAFGRNETCHHIDGVLQADPEAKEIENGAEPKLRY